MEILIEARPFLCTFTQYFFLNLDYFDQVLNQLEFLINALFLFIASPEYHPQFPPQTYTPYYYDLQNPESDQPNPPTGELSLVGFMWKIFFALFASSVWYAVHLRNYLCAPKMFIWLNMMIVCFAWDKEQYSFNFFLWGKTASNFQIINLKIERPW